LKTLFLFFNIFYFRKLGLQDTSLTLVYPNPTNQVNSYTNQQALHLQPHLKENTNYIKELFIFTQDGVIVLNTKFAKSYMSSSEEHTCKFNKNKNILQNFYKKFSNYFEFKNYSSLF